MSERKPPAKAAWREIRDGCRKSIDGIADYPIAVCSALIARILKYVLIVLVVCLLAQNWLLPGGTVFLISAITKGAAIEFSGQSNAWFIGESTLCARRAAPQRSSLASPEADSGQCSPALYEQSIREAGAIKWRPGDKAVLRIDAAGGLVIRIEKHEEFDSGSRLILGRDAWRLSGAMAFSGRLIIGAAMSSGQTAYLVDGRYEVRNRGLDSLFIGGATHTALEGVISIGERVRVAQRRALQTTVVSHGHVTLHEDASLLAFNVYAASGIGDATLILDRSTSSEPSYVRPDWIDSLRSSPVLVGLVIVLTVFANLAQISPTRRQGSTKDSADLPADGKPKPKR